MGTCCAGSWGAALAVHCRACVGLDLQAKSLQLAEAVSGCHRHRLRRKQDSRCHRRRSRGSKRVDVVATVERLPFKESSVDTIYAIHLLEHVEPLVQAIEELWRVSKPGARIHVWAPHFTSGLYVWSDPTHRRGFTSLTFDYFVPGAGLGYYSRARFAVLRRELHFGFRRGNTAVPGLSPATTALKRIVGRLLETVANVSRLAQLLCERTWGVWVSFEEIYFLLAAMKDTGRDVGGR